MSANLIKITVREICEREGISPQQLVTIVEYGIAVPLRGAGQDDWIFDTASAHWMHKALRLRRDLELDWVATSVLIDLLRQREELHRENAALRRQLRRFLLDEQE